MTTESEILFDRRGAAGIVTLNRPGVLNALTHDMVLRLADRLEAWKSDGAVSRVILTANGERAFCAGGDLRGVITRGKEKKALTFFRDEYLLNAAIKRYPKPYVSLIHGIVMGGGVGISAHGSHRVAGEKFQFAMPEAGIGFFPDVGATWLLPRLEGKIGTFCALTGKRLSAADGVMAGAATHFVPQGRFPDLAEALCGDISVDATIAAFAEPVSGGEVFARKALIDSIFAADGIGAILAGLDCEAAARREDSHWAAEAAAAIRAKSPTSLQIALAQMRRGAEWTFEECMRAEYRIVSRVIYEPDFYEGVRAVIVDKDNAPVWKPLPLSETAPHMVERYFAPVEDELPL